ncbi:hypothetical protein GCM10007276_17310 [Agaricicola taiwanensis]|uniref:Uncharacterized protein n=1 Tax=Agaricicola taiwanensis TaxID=591372 RepID=A0A8J2VUU5_9RHOB|nr:hypothetical protein [Agaricicola taiwanensis]GGE40507.1 hypothetical protein GCM10007276_17310 [Agaricicola taiwanensis]
MITFSRIARRFIPLAAVVTVTAGLACAVADRTPAEAMPAPAYQDLTSFSVEPSKVQKAQWKLQMPHNLQNSTRDTETVTARFIGVGALALALAGAFALVLMMFDHMMRRPNGPRRNS